MIELICQIIIFLVVAFIGGTALVVGIQMSCDKDLDDGSHGIPQMIVGIILIITVIGFSSYAVKKVKYRINHATVCTGVDCTDDIHKSKSRQYRNDDVRRVYPLIIPRKYNPIIIPMFR